MQAASVRCCTFPRRPEKFQNIFSGEVENHNATRYIECETEKGQTAEMIKSFKDKEAETIFRGERSRKLPNDIQIAAQRKLWLLDAAAAPEDLRTPPGNRFEALSGRPGFYSIRINVQWRVTFSWNDGAENVRIEDYH